MEQERRQNQPQQPQAPLQCPRCHSTNTKFRYFNNHNTSQPRHYCRDCKRMWTVGGILRNIPVGGTTRIRQTRVTCRSIDSSTQPQPPQLLTSPQNFDAMRSQLLTNFQGPVAPLHSFYFNNEFANWGANQAINVKNQVGFDDDSVNIMRCNDRCLEPNNGLSHQIQGYNYLPNVVDPGFARLNQFHNEAGSSHNLPYHGLVRSTWPVDFTPQEAMNNFSFSTVSSDFSRDKFSGNTTNMDLPSTSADSNQWSKFPGYGPL